MVACRHGISFRELNLILSQELAHRTSETSKKNSKSTSSHVLSSISLIEVVIVSTTDLRHETRTN